MPVSKIRLKNYVTNSWLDQLIRLGNVAVICKRVYDLILGLEENHASISKISETCMDKTTH